MAIKVRPSYWEKKKKKKAAATKQQKIQNASKIQDHKKLNKSQETQSWWLNNMSLNRPVPPRNLLSS